MLFGDKIKLDFFDGKRATSENSFIGKWLAKKDFFKWGDSCDKDTRKWLSYIVPGKLQVVYLPTCTAICQMI